MNSKLKVVLSGLRSDSHTWGLAYLQLWLEERGFHVRNLGSCVEPEMLAETVRSESAKLVVLTSVNGHGAHEGCKAIATLRAAGLKEVPVVIGGKLTTSVENELAAKADLESAGYAAVFTGSRALGEFDQFLESVGLNVAKGALVGTT
jgi:methylaspartate mutase sigma subunit